MGQPEGKTSPRSAPYLNSRATDEKVLKYDDLSIYTSDLRSLQRTSWLTDNIIAFATSYLKDQKLKNFNSYEIVVFPPSFTEIIKFSRDDEEPIVEVDKTKFNFFPINDNGDPSISLSGSHWSLIIYDPNLNRFVFLDSMYMFPPSYVIKFVKKASLIMQLEEVPEILNPICPKMTTNGNCGMFVIEFIDLIFDRMIMGVPDLYTLPSLTDEYISARRKYWLTTAFNLKK